MKKPSRLTVMIIDPKHWSVFPLQSLVLTYIVITAWAQWNDHR